MVSRFNAYEYFIKRHIDEGKGNNVAVYNQGSRYTYQDVSELVEQRYKELFKKVRFASRCGLFMGDSIISLVLYLGMLNEGITPAFISKKTEFESLCEILIKGRFDLLIVGEELLDRSQLDWIIECNMLEKMFVLCKSGELREIYQSESSKDKEKEYEFILFSSGTTGTPKGIVHAQEHMKFAAEIYSDQFMHTTDTDIMYALANLNYTFSFANATFQSFYHASASIISDDTDIWTIIDNINMIRPTILCGVPSVFVMILKMYKVAKIDLSSVRMILCAGEQLPKKVWQEWEQVVGIPIIEGYGSVEVLTNVISNSVNEYIPGSAGKRVEGFEITMDLSKENAGAICITGPCVSDKSIESNEKMGNTYISRDIFEVDDKGYYFYKGRSDTVFKHNGVWFNPLEIENMLENEEEIGEAVVINRELNLIAFVSGNKNVIKEIGYWKTIQKKIKACISHGLCPNEIVIVEEIPRNINGKKIRKMIGEEKWINSMKI